MTRTDEIRAEIEERDARLSKIRADVYADTGRTVAELTEEHEARCGCGLSMYDYAARHHLVECMIARDGSGKHLHCARGPRGLTHHETHDALISWIEAHYGLTVDGDCNLAETAETAAS